MEIACVRRIFDKAKCYSIANLGFSGLSKIEK